MPLACPVVIEHHHVTMVQATLAINTSLDSSTALSLVLRSVLARSAPYPSRGRVYPFSP